MVGYRVIVVSGAPASETSHFLARTAHVVPEVQVAAVLHPRTEGERTSSSFWRVPSPDQSSEDREAA